ncbi:MAG: autotransporter assembly complex protein TamA [Thiohalocapsa sp.]|nr:autotransporter assembly complex protein TamA [Thiohalocapsa sp.]MCF7992312.1 autotransporter assembly complex protein TamA [Thiohalocapsa sp.]
MTLLLGRSAPCPSASPAGCGPLRPWETRLRAAKRRGLKLVLSFGLLLAPALAGAVKLEVQVEGVEGDRQKNVLGLLGIYQEQKDPNLGVARLLALHRRAPDQIRDALAPFGLYRVEIQDELIEPEQEGGRWLARYRIDPGAPVKVARIDYELTGEGASNPAFPKSFPMQVGDVLLHSDYEKAKSKITSAASDEGYLNAQLTRHQVLIDMVAYEAIIEFHVDTGPRYYLGEVRFDQDLLADDYLQEFVTFKPGDVYDPGRLLNLQGRLIGMEYYENVEIKPLMDQAGPDRVIPIEVIAKRNKANKYRVGIGFATDVGPRLSLDYRRRYIGRYGHKLKAELEISQLTQSLIGEYRIPFRNPVQDYILIRPEIYAFDTASRQGTLFKVTAAHSVVTPGGWRRNIGIDYRYEDYEVSDQDSDTFNGLVPNISWSKIEADDPINTRNGFRLKYILQGTLENSLSETTWLSGSVGYKLIKSFGDDYRLITRTDLGVILAGDIQDVPASQRFFAGGDNSVRGWDLDVLGPDDPVTNKTVGGRYLAVGSLELERKIKGNWSGAVFTDFGNAFDPDYTAEWEQSAGLGIRYATPIGPVRVDVAYALTKDPGGFRLHVGLGPDL